MSVLDKLFGKHGSEQEAKPKTRDEAIDRLVRMSNREYRRHFFKKWHKEFDLDWSDITKRIKK